MQMFSFADGVVYPSSQLAISFFANHRESIMKHCRNAPALDQNTDPHHKWKTINWKTEEKGASLVLQFRHNLNNLLFFGSIQYSKVA